MDAYTFMRGLMLAQLSIGYTISALSDNKILQLDCAEGEMVKHGTIDTCNFPKLSVTTVEERKSRTLFSHSLA